GILPELPLQVRDCPEMWGQDANPAGKLAGLASCPTGLRGPSSDTAPASAKPDRPAGVRSDTPTGRLPAPSRPTDHVGPACDLPSRTPPGPSSGQPCSPPAWPVPPAQGGRRR